MALKQESAKSQRLRPDAPHESIVQGLPEYARRVLDAVDQIPLGYVMGYGDVAEYLGEGGPRQVAQVMSRYGWAVNWHRVLRSNGTCAPEVCLEQERLLREEAVIWTRTGRVDMNRSRWDGRAKARPQSSMGTTANDDVFNDDSSTDQKSKRRTGSNTKPR
jgi:methylated-DNA-protein-cysteine methyltransferase related protein